MQALDDSHNLLGLFLSGQPLPPQVSGVGVPPALPDSGRGVPAASSAPAADSATPLHFVVVESCSPDEVCIYDPNTGDTTQAFDTFAQSWTGKALIQSSPGFQLMNLADRGIGVSPMYLAQRVANVPSAQPPHPNPLPRSWGEGTESATSKPGISFLRMNLQHRGIDVSSMCPTTTRRATWIP